MLVLHELCTGSSRPGSCLQLYSGRLSTEREGGLHLCFLQMNHLHRNIHQTLVNKPIWKNALQQIWETSLRRVC